MGMNTDFIKLLANHMENRPFEVQVTQELKMLAQNHQLSPIVYYQTKDDTFRLSYLQAINVYTQRKALLDQIIEAFSDIPYYIVKGLNVSKYYPIPQLRTMGDCDIIVHESDKERAKQILLSLGFKETTGEWDDMEWHFQKQGFDFELHHRLLYDEAVNTEQEVEFTSKAWYYVKNNELDVNFHFVFLLLHLKKHFLNRGVGIRQFMDLALMSINAELNRERIEAFLQQAGIKKFAGVCSALCLRWFGVAFPVDTPEIPDEFYDTATVTILSNGVFGFNVPIDEEKQLLNNVKKSGKAGTILAHLFPSYKICCSTPKYRWIKGKPYLLPVLWIYRLFSALLNGKGKTSAKYVTAVANSHNAMVERDEYLSNWGL